MKKKKLRKHLERVIELRIERIAELCEENNKLRQQVAELTDTVNQLAEKLVQEPI